jgi:lipopolysaccharide/colanic/teichoic acid biosynthesis glycosyltransferase
VLNVLKGDMSLVGPRPPLPNEVATYEEWHRGRLDVRPGITGLWQVRGRSELSFDDYVRLDLFYIENWSILYDLFIMGKTIPAVLLRKGAF